MRKLSEHRIILNAYHEAGHAVAAYILRVPFISVSIIRDSESYGRLNHSKKYVDSIIETVEYTGINDKRGWKRIDNDLTVHF